MRELFAVALSEDGASVVLTTSPDGAGGRFRVALDAQLEAAVRGELPPILEQVPPRESSVTPREIQARLRTGEPVEQIASDAGVDVSRVERFAGPVVSERTQMVDSARAATLVRGRHGPSAVPLGVAVDEQLAALSGLRATTVAWSTVRQETGSWLVELTYVSGGRGKTCRWRYDPYSRVVSAEDPASAELGHLDAVPSRLALNPPGALVVDPGPELFAAGRGTAGHAPVRRAPADATAHPRTETGKETPTAAATGPAQQMPATPAKGAATEQDDRSASAAGSRGQAPDVADDQLVLPVDPQEALRVVPATQDAERVPTTEEPDMTGDADRPDAPSSPHPDPVSPGPQAPRASDASGDPMPASGDPMPEEEAAAPTRTRQAPRQISRSAKKGRRASVPAWADVLLSTSATAEDSEGDHADQDPPTVLRDSDGGAG